MLVLLRLTRWQQSSAVQVEDTSLPMGNVKMEKTQPPPSSVLLGFVGDELA